MGGSSWSDKAYYDRARTRAATNAPVFKHTDDVASGKAKAGVHPTLDPKGVTVRESRDSDAHPTSLAIGVIFDETGSMKHVPALLEKKLVNLMQLLIQKGYVAHPQILFGAIGDANSDVAPLQVGQFESGNEMEEVMALIYLEGNGGGQKCETYELAHYFFARHTAIDCWEKRGHKGYLFTIGDEKPYDVIRKAHVKQLIGDDLEADIPFATLLAELQERYHVFHLIAEKGGYPYDAEVEAKWRDYLGERVLKLDDTDDVCELIATTIGLTEGTTDLDQAARDLADVGTTKGAIDHVTQSLTPYAASAVVKTGTAVGLPKSETPVGSGIETL